MTNQTTLLHHTHQSFASFIREKLGKGHVLSTFLYQEWLTTGKILGKNRAFNNAQRLFEDILALIDFSLPELLPVQRVEGETLKFLLKTLDGYEVESVCIPMQSGFTLCVSSQVGCRMGCSFCETGKMGLLRNLTPSEIVSQVFTAKFRLQIPIRNIVFMGMGEPFDNYDNVMQAIRVLMDPLGFGFGANHITVSTSGSIDGIYRLMQEKDCRVNLAVSLNAPNNELRHNLMPINRKYGMEALYQTMFQYSHATGKEILAAYVLIQGVNDSINHAREFARYLRGLHVKVNVIPYNPQSRDRFGKPSESSVNEFIKELRNAGYRCLVRTTKGQNIMAACGQLGNLALRRTILKRTQEEL